jgi:hypothetical protein
MHEIKATIIKRYFVGMFLSSMCQNQIITRVSIQRPHPSLQVLSITNQEEIVEFCRKEGLVLLADEVRTVWQYKPFALLNHIHSVLRNYFLQINYQNILTGIPREYLCREQKIPFFQESGKITWV